MQTLLHSGPEVDSRRLLYIPSYPIDCEHTAHPQTEKDALKAETETEKQRKNISVDIISMQPLN